MDDALAQRVDALERAITDGDGDLTALADETEALERLESVESTVEDLEERVRELEGATQALRGYVGNVRSVNQDVEQRAEAALAKAEDVEARLQHHDTIDAEPDTAPAANSRSQTPTATQSNPATATTEGTDPATAATDQTATAPNPSDGGGGEQHSGDPGRCHACGRRQSDDETATSGQPTTQVSVAGRPDATEDLVPDESQETGPLRRVRNLL